MKRYELEDEHPDLPTDTDFGIEDVEQELERRRVARQSRSSGSNWDTRWPAPPF